MVNWLLFFVFVFWFLFFGIVSSLDKQTTVINCTTTLKHKRVEDTCLHGTNSYLFSCIDKIDEIFFSFSSSSLTLILNLIFVAEILIQNQNRNSLQKLMC